MEKVISLLKSDLIKYNNIIELGIAHGIVDIDSIKVKEYIERLLDIMENDIV